MAKLIQLGTRVSPETYGKLVKLANERCEGNLTKLVREILDAYESEPVKPTSTKKIKGGDVILSVQHFALIDRPTTIKEEVGGVPVYINIEETICFYETRSSSRKKVLIVFTEFPEKVWTVAKFCARKAINYRFMTDLEIVLSGKAHEYCEADWWVNFYNLTKLIVQLPQDIPEEIESLIDELELLEDMPMTKENYTEMHQRYEKIRVFSDGV